MTTKNHFRRKPQKIRDAEAEVYRYSGEGQQPVAAQTISRFHLGDAAENCNRLPPNGTKQESEQSKKGRSDSDAHNTYIRNLQQLLEAQYKPSGGNAANRHANR